MLLSFQLTLPKFQTFKITLQIEIPVLWMFYDFLFGFNSEEIVYHKYAFDPRKGLIQQTYTD